MGCSPSTIGCELKRGTPQHIGRGQKPKYSAKRGGEVYRQHREKCHRKKTISRDSRFLRWMIEKIQTHKWSFDVCVGRACHEKTYFAHPYASWERPI